jgi:hypothetical protein
MIQDGEPPILVSGMPRSGTTWIQWLLCQHPRIHVHGQSPNLPWNAWWEWQKTLVRQSAWSVQANRHHGYEIAHYAGSDAERSKAVFKRMFRDWLTGHGPEKPRWGLKWLRSCAIEGMVEQFESLWPETRWVVCVRDPFVSLSSQKNTFVPNQDLREYALDWVRTCMFLESRDAKRVIGVQIDKLHRATQEQRRATIERVLSRVGEGPSDETDAFVSRWPRVHKVKPDHERKFALSEHQKQRLLEEVPGLGRCMERMGYAAGGLRVGRPLDSQP